MPSRSNDGSRGLLSGRKGARIAGRTNQNHVRTTCVAGQMDNTVGREARRRCDLDLVILFRRASREFHGLLAGSRQKREFYRGRHAKVIGSTQPAVVASMVRARTAKNV
jgi:hypothetical protein